MSLEHRWNERQSTDLNVTLSVRPYGLRQARIRNVSTSGVFVELSPSSPTPPLPVNAHVELIFVRPENHVTRLLRVPALVVRSTPEGAGLIFRDFSLGAFRTLLTQLLAEKNPPPPSTRESLEQIRLNALQRLANAMDPPAATSTDTNTTPPRFKDQ